MTRNSILGNGLEEKTQERGFMVKRRNRRISPTLRKETRKLTLDNYYTPGTVLGAFTHDTLLNPHNNTVRKMLLPFYK